MGKTVSDSDLLKRKRNTNHLWVFFCLLCMAVWFSLQWIPGYGFTRAISFGDYFWPDRISTLEEEGVFVREDSFGYDGQFYAQIALDPSMASEEYGTAIDGPAYRGRRILLPLTGFLAGLGNPRWIINVFPFLNIIAWLGLFFLLLRMLPENNWQNRARMFAILFAMGSLESIKFSLTDLPSAVLILWAIYFLNMDSKRGAVAAFAGAILTKETSALALVTLPANAVDLRKNFLRYTGAAILALAPFLIWAVYLNLKFVPASGIPTNFSLPFFQLYEVARALFTEFGEYEWLERDLLGSIAMVGLLFQVGYLLFHPKIENRLWRIGIVYALLLIVLGPAVWHGYWAVCRSILPMTFAFNLLYKPKRHFWLGWLVANASILHGLIRI